MTEISMALLELLRKHGLDENVDFLREGLRLLSQLVMELEVSDSSSGLICFKPINYNHLTGTEREPPAMYYSRRAITIMSCTDEGIANLHANRPRAAPDAKRARRLTADDLKAALTKRRGG